MSSGRSRRTTWRRPPRCRCRTPRPLSPVRLEEEGFALRGRFTDPDGAEEFCARRLLTRIHGYTRQRRRREIEPVTAQDFMRFMLRWQHVTPDTRREGSRGVLAVVEQLQGFEL